MKKETKAEIFARYGIEYDRKTNKVKAPEIGWTSLPLVDGNKKIGKGIYHFSTLPGTAIYTLIINGVSYDVKGTCPCDCIGCYAMTGNYRFRTVKNALARRTFIARNYTSWLEKAILAQIDAFNIKFIRIHASGDFFSIDYIAMWQRIAAARKDVSLWTYTKNPAAVSAFDGLDNANIVKSIIPSKGKNYGTCDYILALYEYLKAAGKPVYICRCGIDPAQHCTNCKGCSVNEYVLFLEHSTGYKAANDPLFPVVKKIVENQETPAAKKASEAA